MGARFCRNKTVFMLDITLLRKILFSAIARLETRKTPQLPER
jgi:hypothetical protein